MRRMEHPKPATPLAIRRLAEIHAYLGTAERATHHPELLGGRR